MVVGLPGQVPIAPRIGRAHDEWRLELDVEASKAKVPGAEQFRELLEHAVRIAEINADVNQQVEPS